MVQRLYRGGQEVLQTGKEALRQKSNRNAEVRRISKQKALRTAGLEKDEGGWRGGEASARQPVSLLVRLVSRSGCGRQRGGGDYKRRIGDQAYGAVRRCEHDAARES